VVAERLRAAIESTEILKKKNGDRHVVTASLGLSQWKPFDTVDTIIQRADEALYRAKVAGRNRTECVDS
jgi:diguanylate cyclase (GGDEF)-like protein